MIKPCLRCKRRGPSSLQRKLGLLDRDGDVQRILDVCATCFVEILAFIDPSEASGPRAANETIERVNRRLYDGDTL